MGCSDSKPVASVYEYCFPVDENVPILGSKQGVKPSSTGPLELVMGKKMWQGKGGNSYVIKNRVGMKDFYSLEVKGKAGRFSKDQMDVIYKPTQEPVAVLMRYRDNVLDERDKFKIYSPVPLYQNQRPEIQYGESKTPMYVYARVHEKTKQGLIIFVTLDHPTSDADATTPAPTYTCRPEKTKKYIYKGKRQCAFIRDGTQNSLLIKLNPGIDPVLILCISAILDEMD